ncbi:MAG TPA: transglycosylase family protein [Streptosporangiaceae bacterium]|nr:transglycosylase family protein [Streptosporangiaceae bacterium]
MPQAAAGAVAAPALAGVATAFVSPQAALAATAPPPATQAALHHVTLPAAYQRPSPAHLLAAARQAKAHKSGTSLPAWYTVRGGDSLSAIAGRFYHDTAAWPVLYWSNHSQIRWADIIRTGQRLRIPAKPATIPRPPSALGPRVYVPRHAAPAHSPAQSAPARPAPHRSASATAAWSGAYPGGAFGACVVARESGGNAQVMNSSGHYGLYQFAYSTWVAYGGNPADFGHASVAEQNRVFANALARGGQNNWAPYDGC